MNQKQLSHEELVRLIMNSKKVVFFCGSGVSQFSPTNLPSGYDLVKFCIGYLENQYQVFEKKSIKLEDIGKLPLELMIEFIIGDIREKQYTPQLLKIKSFFKEAPANIIHYFISCFLAYKSNCHIITTNYDTGFEKALKRLKKKVYPIEVFGIEKIKNIKIPNSNCIFKIHGCSNLDHEHNLVLTTSQEASGLPIQFQEKLKELFEDSLVVFCGYSLSEPDCLEALLTVSNYDAVWFDKDIISYNNNSRAQLVLKNANKSYYVEDLIPLFKLTIDEFRTIFPNQIKPKINSHIFKIPFNYNARENSLALCSSIFKKLFNVSTPQKLFSILIFCFMHIRDFRKVEFFLERYKTLDGYSHFVYFFSKASITRDKNRNWELAHHYFDICANLESIRSLDKKYAIIEKLGLETLIHQHYLAKIKNIQKKIQNLIVDIKNQLKDSHPDDELKWYRLQGIAQKNLIHNIGYQKSYSEELLRKGLLISRETNEILFKCNDIHTRIETERVTARIYYKLFCLNKNREYLNQTLVLSNRSVLFAEILVSNLGEINSRRQLAFYLIKSGNFVSAEKEIDKLYELISSTYDDLSKIKLLALESYLNLSRRRIISFCTSFFHFLLLSARSLENISKLHNIRKMLRWFFSWLKGNSG